MFAFSFSTIRTLSATPRTLILSSNFCNTEETTEFSPMNGSANPRKWFTLNFSFICPFTLKWESATPSRRCIKTMKSSSTLKCWKNLHKKKWNSLFCHLLELKIIITKRNSGEKIEKSEDLVRSYNNKNVFRFVETLQKLVKFYHKKWFDILKLGREKKNLADFCQTNNKSSSAKVYPRIESDKDLLEKKSSMTWSVLLWKSLHAKL